MPTVCVCVCFSNVLAVPDFANAAHTRGVAAQSSALEHRQGSGVPTGFRARCSAFTGVSTTQEGPRSAFFTCPARQLMSQLPDHTEWQVLKTRGIRETEPLQAGICPPLKKRICVESVRSSGPWEEEKGPWGDTADEQGSSPWPGGGGGRQGTAAGPRHARLLLTLTNEPSDGSRAESRTCLSGA